jgi:hypothetical protein
VLASQPATATMGVTKMREGKLATFLCCALTLLCAVAYAGSPPKELYGKSIIVTWGEHRSQRELGRLATHSRLRAHDQHWTRSVPHNLLRDTAE